MSWWSAVASSSATLLGALAGVVSAMRGLQRLPGTTPSSAQAAVAASLDLGSHVAGELPLLRPDPGHGRSGVAGNHWHQSRGLARRCPGPPEEEPDRRKPTLLRAVLAGKNRRSGYGPQEIVTAPFCKRVSSMGSSARGCGDGGSRRGDRMLRRVRPSRWQMRSEGPRRAWRRNGIHMQMRLAGKSG